MPIAIKPKVEEISLAFNPANKRKFILHKDEKGGSVMPKFAISVLEKDEAATNEEAFAEFLKDQKLDKDTADVVLGAYRLMTFSKDQLPEKFVSKLHKSFPDVFPSIEVQKDEKALKATIEKDLRVTLEKEIQTSVEKEMGMSKDVEIKTLADMVKNLKKESDATKKLLVVEKDARRLGEIHGVLKKSGVPGDLDKMAKDVLDAEKVNPELGKNFLASYKDLGTTFKASEELFKEIGSSAGGIDADSAQGEMEKLAKDKMKADDSLSQMDAWKQVAQEDPALYGRYNKEHYKKIRDAS